MREGLAGSESVERQVAKSWCVCVSVLGNRSTGGGVPEILHLFGVRIPLGTKGKVRSEQSVLGSLGTCLSETRVLDISMWTESVVLKLGALACGPALGSA